MISTTPIEYSSLNPRQKEAYNAAKLASVLADYGYTCVRLHDDYEAGDLLALRPGEVHSIQLKGRPTIARKYTGKGLLLAFPHRTDAAVRSWYVVPHDELVEIARAQTTALSSRDWNERGAYSWPRPSQELLRALQPYRVR